MNVVLQHRKSFSLLAAPLLVLTMARLVFLGGLSNFQIEIPRLSMRHSVVSKPLSVRPDIRPTTVKTTDVLIVPSNSVKMNSIAREYHYTFSGHVTCGSQACPRDVHITLDSDHNENVMHTVQTELDGSFSKNVTIREYARRPVDWRMQVNVVDSVPVEVHGRTILSEETTIEISRSLSLPE